VSVVNAASSSSSAAPSPTARRAWTIAWPWLFWSLWGVWLACSDLRNDEVQPAVLLLLVGGAVLGYARPRAWWAWALALAAWIPAEYLLSPLIHVPPQSPFNPGTALLPPIPALLGAAAGMGLQRMRRFGSPRAQA
jgi:hypothetical protein